MNKQSQQLFTTSTYSDSEDIELSQLFNSTSEEMGMMLFEQIVQGE